VRYGTLCNDWTDFAKVATESEKWKALADKYMRALGYELKAMKLSLVAKRKENKIQATAQGDTPMGDLGGDGGQGTSTPYPNVRDPIITTTKGHPGEKRKKSGLHLNAKKL
jgi:hypothetical protein